MVRITHRGFQYLLCGLFHLAVGNVLVHYWNAFMADISQEACSERRNGGIFNSLVDGRVMISYLAGICYSVGLRLH